VRGAEVIDLVQHDDPEVGIFVRRVGDRIPVGDGDVLDPLHPHRIVDVPQLVDVLGPRQQGHFEDLTRH